MVGGAANIQASDKTRYYSRFPYAVTLLCRYPGDVVGPRGGLGLGPQCSAVAGRGRGPGAGRERAGSGRAVSRADPLVFARPGQAWRWPGQALAPSRAGRGVTADRGATRSR